MSQVYGICQISNVSRCRWCLGAFVGFRRFFSSSLVWKAAKYFDVPHGKGKRAWRRRRGNEGKKFIFLRSIFLLSFKRCGGGGALIHSQTMFEIDENDKDDNILIVVAVARWRVDRRWMWWRAIARRLMAAQSPPPPVERIAAKFRPPPNTAA